MKKTLVILLTLALAAPVAVLAQPGQGQGDRPCDNPGGFNRHCSMDGPHGPGSMGRHGGRGMGMKGDGPGGFGFGFMAFADEIELTDAQQKQLADMRTKFQKDGIDKRAALEKAQVDLRSLMTDDDAAESAVLRQIDVVNGLKGDLQKMRFSHGKEMKAVLTAEQLAKIKDLRAERRSEHRQGRGQSKGMGQMGRP